MGIRTAIDGDKTAVIFVIRHFDNQVCITGRTVPAGFDSRLGVGVFALAGVDGLLQVS